MKNTGFWLAVWLASTVVSSAQPVKVEVLLSQKEFIVGEPIPVAVRIVNHSGQTIHFGDEAWVSYSVEATDGFVVIKNGEAPMAHGFDIATSKMATQHSDLQPYFGITKGGRYAVTATVRIKDWGQELTSDPMNFDIIRGTKIWEQEFGVPQPGSAGSKGEPEIRKYSLQRANYLNRLRLYLRVSDPSEAKILKTIPLGPIVSFGEPRTQLDTHNNLHLLYEDGSRSFNYTVTSPDGDMLVRQTYYYTDAAPRLTLDESGNITVAGGVRRVTSTDLPAPQSSVSLHDLPPPKTP
jgi:hypothetical protein